MPKRQRIDSVTAAVRVMAGASASELLPPAHNPLPEDAMPFWRAIAQGRARAEWDETPALLSTAASLAWVQWQIVQWRGMAEQAQAGAGDGEISVAQMLSRLAELQRLEMAYLKILQQHGQGVRGDTRDAVKRRLAEKAIETSSPFLGDDFLARPADAMQ